MIFKNTNTEYGIGSKLFHLSFVLLVFTQVLLIIYVKLLPEKSPLIGFLVGGLHKPIGMLTLIVVLLALLWKYVNIHPAFPQTMPRWQIFAARLTHNLLYLSLIVMPLSGLIMSVAAGQPPNFFGLYQVPMFMEKNKEIAGLFFDVHAITAIILVGLIVLHTLAALKHHFIDHDNVLRRMWSW